jgi:hypothetical protein
MHNARVERVWQRRREREESERMDLRIVWLFLHIATMFAAVTLSYGITTLLRVAYGTGQTAAVRGVGMTAGKVGRYIPMLFVAGGIFGLITGITYGYNLLAPWLIIAYVLFVIAMILGVAENAPFGAKLGKLLMQTPDGPLTAEIRELFDEPRTVALLVVDYLVVILLIFDMVVKPFGA